MSCLKHRLLEHASELASAFAACHLDAVWVSEGPTLRLLALPGEGVSLGDFIDAEETLAALLGAMVELVSVRSEHGKDLLPSAQRWESFVAESTADDATGPLARA